MHKYLQGEKFGRLTLVRIATESTNKHKTWECLCECGNTTFVQQYNLWNGHTQSCGCLQREILIERNQQGKWNSETLIKNHRNIYVSWNGMLSRCYHNHRTDYKLYGARGIVVCAEWKNNFLTFLDWSIKNGWQPRLSIDRIDNNGNYNPENCRWTDRKTQSNNRRSNRLININGQTNTLTQWSEISGITTRTISRRINAGWDISKWLIHPAKKPNGVICE